MDNQTFRKDIEENLSRLNAERDEALINIGKKLGAIEVFESILNVLEESEAGEEPASTVKEESTSEPQPAHLKQGTGTSTKRKSAK